MLEFVMYWFCIRSSPNGIVSQPGCVFVIVAGRNLKPTTVCSNVLGTTKSIIALNTTRMNWLTSNHVA